MSRSLLAALTACAALASSLGCADLTAPGRGAPRQEAAPAPRPAAAPPEPAPEPLAPTPAPPENEEQVGAAHLLIQYKGSMRAGPNVTRSKAEASKLAAELLKRARGGEDFTKLAGKYSDEPGAAQRGGDLGKFTRRQMVKPFADVAFALKPGQIGPAETDFGFHVIRRSE